MNFRRNGSEYAPMFRPKGGLSWKRKRTSAVSVDLPGWISMEHESNASRAVSLWDAIRVFLSKSATEQLSEVC